MRTHTNIAEYCNRRLKRLFSADGTTAGTSTAIGVTAPTLQSQSMGYTGKNGVVSFVCLDGGTQNFTLLEWHQGIADLNSGNGWILNGANSSEYTKNCDQLSKISFTASEGVDFFILAGTLPVTDAFVSGTESGSNKNTFTGGNTR